MKQKIKQYFNDIIYSGSGLRKRINSAPKQYIQYCENILKNQPKWEKISYVIIGICSNIQLAFCKTCGKKLTYNKTIKAKRTGNGYCNKSCVFKNSNIRKNIREKQLQTNMKKYGCKHPAQSQIVKNKMKQTCLERYNVPIYLSSKIARKKIKQTNLKKYNCENVFGAKEIQAKIKQTNKIRYGEEIYANSSDFKEKQLDTFLQKYDGNTPFSSKEIQNKVKNTILEKYGVSNIFQLQENVNKCNAVKYEKVWKNILTWHQYIIPLFQYQQYNGKNEIYKWKCVKCGNEFEQRIYTTHFNKRFNCLPRCLTCYPFKENLGISLKEKQVVQFCKQYFPNLIQNDRQLIFPKQLDIVIPQIKLAIQFNGIYWHSLQAGYQLGYHLMKTEKCQACGYRLLHIWEDQWQNSRKLIQEKLISIFKNKEEIFSEDILKLDRNWYQNKEIEGYRLIKIQEPIITIKNNNICENTGYLIYKKLNI